MGIVQTVLSEENCSQCGRVAFAQAVCLVVEGAIDVNGHSPVVSELLALRDSKNKRKRARYYDLQERFDQLAAYGTLEEPLQMNVLRENLWEVKTSTDRVPFYWMEANAIHQRAVRLTHHFEKATGRTAQGAIPRGQIDRGVWVMKGDKAHDKTDS